MTSVLHSRIIWEKAWRVRVDTVQTPGGGRSERAAVEHPGSVVLVPLREKAGRPHILALRQYRFTLQETILELPAGTRGWEEPWPDCAQRELREETGYRADGLIPLGHVWPAPGITDEEMAIFLALGLVADPLPADEDEELVVEEVALAELLAMALDGRLQDAKSIVAVVRTAAYLRQSGTRAWEIP